MEKDADLIIKVYAWILDHPNHPSRRDQINKYLELKSRYTDTEFWHDTCRELDALGYTELTPEGHNASYRLSSEAGTLSELPDCLLPQEFALVMSKRLSR